MGFDGIYSVYRKYNDKYEKMAFYNKEGKELYDPFPSRDGMLNQLLLGYNRHGYDFDDLGAGRGVPEWYVNLLKEENPDWFDNDGSWNYNPDEGTYYDYLELVAWEGNPRCNQVDWMEVEEEYDENGDLIEIKPGDLPRRNPLVSFMAQVRAYLNAYGVYYPKPGEVIIVCEMSY